MRHDNIQFLKDSTECNKLLSDIAKVGDQLLISFGDKGQPLWGDTTAGFITEISKESVSLRNPFLPFPAPSAKSAKKKNKIKTKLTSNVYVFDNTIRGYRLDKNWLFCRSESNKDRDTTRITKALQCKPFLVRFTNRPEHNFIHRARIGDYITIYSQYDAVVKNFLHYPCIGWLLEKDVKNETVTFINPPNMNPKTYKIKGNEQAFYIYRKFVLQVGEENK